MKKTFFVLVLIALVLFSTNSPSRSYKPDRYPTICPSTERFFVMRGKAVVIPIRVAILIRVEFGPQQLRDDRDAVLDIIKQPSFGALSNLRQPIALPPTPENRPFIGRVTYENLRFIGSVTYTPGNDLTSQEDSFSYQVTDPITGKRVRGRIKILIGNASSISGK